MGCNCKNKLNIFRKLADGETTEGLKSNGGGFSFGRAIKAVLLGINQFILGLVASVIVIIFFVPMILYVIVCLLFGLEPHIVIKNPRNLFKWKKRKQPNKVV